MVFPLNYFEMETLGTICAHIAVTALHLRIWTDLHACSIHAGNDVADVEARL